MAAAVEGEFVVPMAGERHVAGARGDGRQGVQRGVRALDVSGVVRVVVKFHGLLVDGGLQRGVVVRQRRQDELAVLEADLALLEVASQRVPSPGQHRE